MLSPYYSVLVVSIILIIGAAGAAEEKASPVTAVVAIVVLFIQRFVSQAFHVIWVPFSHHRKKET